jgi:signal transduction histidine kinase
MSPMSSSERALPQGSQQVFSWDSQYTPEDDIRAKVLVDRAVWVTQIRWVAVALLVVGTTVAELNWLPARLDPRLFAAAGAFIALTNVVYTRLVKKLAARANHTEPLRRAVLAQVFTDYMALSLITYACGTIETPILILFLPHVILLSLFFSRRTSALMTAVGLLFAAAPMALEMAGVVPAISILELPLKAKIISEPPLSLAFLGGLGTCYFFIWYLTSTITKSLKLRELQLEQANEAMVRLDREKTLATLRATHELKAPFAAIQGYVYSLRDGLCGPLPERALQVLGRINDRCNRLKAMITDIIHLSNLRSAVIQEGDFIPVDVVALVAEEILEQAVAAQPRKISVVPHFTLDQRFWVRAAPRALHTLVSNLLRNAIKYSHDDGQVEVDITERVGRVVLTIRDHGIGISQEALPKIFDDYFRSNAAVAHNPQGNGLGLAMVKEIAKLHDAVIEVQSDVGKGSLFSITFLSMKEPQEGEAHGKGTDH